jgi:hypothetical protein
MFSEKVEHQLKKRDVTQQTQGYPRFLKRGNIDTEIFRIIHQ